MAAWFSGTDHYLAACLKASRRLIGLIAIERQQDEAGCVHNLGYVFHTAYHGKGYATEVCRAAMAYLFEELTTDRILTGTHPDNVASVALLRRLGLSEAAQGEFTLSREQWQAKRAVRNRAL